MSAPTPNSDHQPGAIATPAQAMPASIDPDILLARLEGQDTAQQIATLETLLGQLARDLSKAQG